MDEQSWVLSSGLVECRDLGAQQKPAADRATRWRQAIEESATVRSRDDAWVGNHDDAAISCRANQPAEPLIEAERRVRQHVLGERLAPAGRSPSTCCRTRRM